MNRFRGAHWDGVAALGLGSVCVFRLLTAAYETDIGDADETSSFPPTPRNGGLLTKASVDDLNRDGIIVMHDVLGSAELIDAHNGAVAVYEEGRMNFTANSSEVRQDRVCWVQELDGVLSSSGSGIQKLQPGLLNCVKLLRGLSTELKELGYCRSFNHLVPKQCQLSRYSGDGSQAYMAHRDAARADNFWEIGVLEWLRSRDYRSRRVTAILYLNLPGWDKTADGGELLCFVGCDAGDDTGITSKSVQRVTPTGATLVIFDSTYLLHEVTPSRKDRYALTIWITGEDEFPPENVKKA